MPDTRDIMERLREAATKARRLGNGSNLDAYQESLTELGRAYIAAYPTAEALRAAPPVVPQGWKLVPVEPTPEMQWAGVVGLDRASHSDIDPTTEEVAACYRAMLAAAPQAPQPAPTPNPLPSVVFEARDAHYGY